MATKKPNPFAKFEKSASDKDTPAVTKKFGKEGSKKEEAFDKKQMGGKRFGFADGGAVQNMEGRLTRGAPMDQSPRGMPAGQPMRNMRRRGVPPQGAAQGRGDAAMLGRNMPQPELRGDAAMAPRPVAVQAATPVEAAPQPTGPGTPGYGGSTAGSSVGGMSTAPGTPGQSVASQPGMLGSSTRGFSKGGMVRRGWGKARGA